MTPSSGQQSANGHSSRSTHHPALTRETINPAVLEVEYAVRGELALKADKYVQQLASSSQGHSGSAPSTSLPSTSSPTSAKDKGRDAKHASSNDLPFDKVVTANIGNPQQKGLDQKPITFWRQVISLLEYPQLFTDHLEVAREIYPEDAIERAKGLHEEIGSVGAYTHSKGVLAIRKRVAKFIEKRDGYPADPECIYLTSGASQGVANLLGLALKPGEGCMIPIPQYPLYTATLAYVNATPIPYYLQEPKNWSMNHQVLVSAIEKAKKDGVKVKALVIINPGNPTGSCLTKGAIQEVIQLCYDEGIVLMADEVYQTNIFDPENKPFVSFKKVLRSMPEEVANGVELVSFQSISKGVSGECGRRGGYFELANISEEVQEQIYKMASVSLCPPVSGQIGVDLLVSPPQPGDPSYELYESETSTTFDHLRSRSLYMAERFNALPGMSCQPAEGAMYLFPRIEMPQRAVDEAKERGKEADVMYALDLLDATGICAVAGSGFGQEPGTYHIRLTALCPGVEEYVGKIEEFHKAFLGKYKD